MAENTLYRFVKASERLPDFENAPDDFGIIFTNKEQVKTFTVYPSYTKNITALLQNKLDGWEWLEKFPINEQEEVWKEIAARMYHENDDEEWLRKNFILIKKQ